jgi:hypothetical protein
VRPIISELLQAAGLTKIAENRILVTGIRGPLEDGWEAKVQSFAEQVLTTTAGIQTQ